MAKCILRVDEMRERLRGMGLDLDCFTLAGDGDAVVLVYSSGPNSSGIVVIEDDELFKSTVKYLMKKAAAEKLP